MRVRVLVCPCGYEVPINPLDLEGITIHPIGKPNFEACINFVCPGCGLSTVHRVDDIAARSFQVPNLRRTNLFHADLKCEKEGCAARTTVHTVPENDKPNAGPMKEARFWQVGHIYCHSGHLLKQPAELTAKPRITNSADDSAR